MISQKDKILIERNLISLLLKDKGTVSDWRETGPEISFFEAVHQMLLNAIIYAFSQDSLLTIRSLRDYLKNNSVSKLDILSQENQFNLASMLYVNQNDFHVLKSQIMEAHVSRISIDAVELFRSDMIAEGSVAAVKTLSSSLSNILGDASKQKTVIYESLEKYMPDFKELLISRKEGKAGKIIKCGIKEIDYAMLVGFAPGTLTLFCADVGGYKCLPGNILLKLENGHDITIDEVNALKEKKQQLPVIASLNEDSQKSCYQQILNIVYNGKQKVYKTRTEAGFEILSTKNHKFLTFNKFLELSELSRGDFVAISRKANKNNWDKIDKKLFNNPEADIFWDKIKSIEFVGFQDVYDLCMPKYHNFIANDFIVHNSTMMVNVALNVWKEAAKNVLFVPLEMPRDKITEKVLSRELKIPFEKFEGKGQLSEKDWSAIDVFEKELSQKENKLYIMESPERVPVSVIRREIEKHIDLFQPDLVVIDYIGNLIPELASKRDRPDIQIGEMLKDLRHMGRVSSITKEGFAVVSGAQIGREALKRVRKMGGKVSFHSEDLRGSHEYSADADNIFAQMEDAANPDSTLNLFVVKSRYGRKAFPDGSTKASLDIVPEIGLLRSKNDAWLASEQSQSNILSKLSSVSEDDWDSVVEEDVDNDTFLVDEL